jgi:hypothetical protein
VQREKARELPGGGSASNLHERDRDRERDRERRGVRRKDHK